MLAFMDQLELAGRVQLVANRVERALFRETSLDEQERVLGRRFAHSIAADDQAMALAVAQGKTLADVRASARMWKDIKAMASAIEAQITPRSVVAGAQ
jgi:Flp pilus assembly CpaE family ATPase